MAPRAAPFKPPATARRRRSGTVETGRKPTYRGTKLVTEPPDMRIIPLALIAFVALLGLPAEAQSRCGDVHALEPGQTLFGVSQTCRIALTRIHRLNPDLADSDEPEAGTEIRLAPRRGERPPDSDQPATYRVAEGDSALSIADRFGIPLVELLHRNEDLDPAALEVGEVLDIPADGRGAAVSVSPLAGPPGARITLRAGSLRPGDSVTIGAGSSAAAWTPIGSAMVAANGVLEASVAIPASARPGDILTIFVDTDRGATLKSADFDVLDGTLSSEAAATVEGWIRRGEKCPTLTTPEGELFSLTSERLRFVPDDYVRIEGRRGPVAACGQGIATIDAAAMNEIRAPGNLPRATTAPNPDDLVGPWVPKGGDCRQPAFAMEQHDEVVTVSAELDGAPQEGRVAFSGDTTSMSFEATRHSFGLERRGAGEMAVIAAPGVTATFGAVTVDAHGQVFVRCFQ